MSSRKLDISRLMDAYEDTEFMPEEEILVDTEHIKQEVMKTVKGKRRTSRRAAIVAAALCACLALVGWTYGERIYQFISGSQVTISGSAGMGSGTITMSDGLDENGDPTIISLENGRLWFVADGQRVDVTSQVNENTPYVWTQWEKNGGLHYIIVGGTPEDYGWFEGIELPGDSGGGSGMLHSREDIPWEEFVQDPDWYRAGLSQVEELWESQNG